MMVFSDHWRYYWRDECRRAERGGFRGVLIVDGMRCKSIGPR
jgi:alkanesulfonate monooxygenase SsuD/methylene tetrahydromethanopterin reductase-like flavin-dependent oxidoreductase (luciferase family)